MWDYSNYDSDYSDVTNTPAYSTIIKCEFSDESTTEPVSLTEAKNWLRISLSETTFDNQVQMVVTAARQAIEEYLNSSLIKRTVTVAMNIAPGGANLPFQPVIAFTSATDRDGNAIDASDYTLSGAVLDLGNYNQAVLVYDGGYDDVTKVPVVFKSGILRLVAFDWENRGDVSATRNIGQITGLKTYRRVV